MEIPSRRVVAIVCFDAEKKNATTAEMMRDGFNQAIPVPRVVLYQVTIDPTRISPSKKFMRFGVSGDGKGDGDEITGWQPIEALEIIEILAEENEAGELISVVHEQPQPEGEQEAA